MFERCKISAWAIFAAVLIGPLVLLPSANAGMITYQTYATGFLNNGFVPAFDPSLGTLTEVDFSATGGVSTSFYVFGVGTVTGSYTAFAEFIAVNSKAQDTLLVSANYQGTFAASGDSSLFLVNIDQPINLSSKIVQPSQLSNFVGGGMINLQIGGSITITSISTPVFQFQGAGSGANETLTYIYTAVPEPGSLGMMVAGVTMAVSWVATRKLPKGGSR